MLTWPGREWCIPATRTASFIRVPFSQQIWLLRMSRRIGNKKKRFSRQIRITAYGNNTYDQYDQRRRMFRNFFFARCVTLYNLKKIWVIRKEMGKKRFCDKMDKWLKKKRLFYKLFTKIQQFCVFHIFQTFFVLNTFFSFINLKKIFGFLIFTLNTHFLNTLLLRLYKSYIHSLE